MLNLLNFFGLYTRRQVQTFVADARYEGASEMVDRYAPTFVRAEKLEDELERMHRGTVILNGPSNLAG